jgi:hypothetical protein
MATETTEEHGNNNNYKPEIKGCRSALQARTKGKTTIAGAHRVRE